MVNKTIENLNNRKILEILIEIKISKSEKSMLAMDFSKKQLCNLP